MCPTTTLSTHLFIGMCAAYASRNGKLTVALVSTWRDVPKEDVMKFMPAPADVGFCCMTFSKSNVMGMLVSPHLTCVLVCEKMNDSEAALVRPLWLAGRFLPEHHTDVLGVAGIHRLE